MLFNNVGKHNSCLPLGNFYGFHFFVFFFELSWRNVYANTNSHWKVPLCLNSKSLNKCLLLISSFKRNQVPSTNKCAPFKCWENINIVQLSLLKVLFLSFHSTLKCELIWICNFTPTTVTLATLTKTCFICKTSSTYLLLN